jgi:hypothetical protein
VVLRQGKLIVVYDIELLQMSAAGPRSHLHCIHQVFDVVQRNAVATLTEDVVRLPQRESQQTHRKLAAGTIDNPGPDDGDRQAFFLRERNYKLLRQNLRLSVEIAQLR